MREFHMVDGDLGCGFPMAVGDLECAFCKGGSDFGMKSFNIDFVFGFSMGLRK